MADPTTLFDLATSQHTGLTADLAAAQTSLIAAQADYAAAAKARDDANQALAKTAADIASLRAQLASVPTPEDITDLLKKLQADIVQSRLQSGTLAGKERAVVDAKAVLDGVVAEAQRLTAAVALSLTALHEATAQAKTRNDLKTRLANPPLSTIKADASAILAGTAFLDPGDHFKFADAQNRLNSDLPAALITEAEHRLQDEIARANSSEDEYLTAQQDLEAKWTSDLGTNGAVLATQNVFDRAEAKFTDFVVNAADRFQQAKTSLTGVADPKHSPLTPAQKTAINEAGAVTAATAAVAAEQAVDDAVDDLTQKQAILDEKIRAAEAADPEADPATNPAVVTATGIRDSSKATLTAAKTAYAAVQAGMTTWESLVPDSEWQLLYDFERAKLILGALDPGTLQADMDTAEQNLVKALIAAGKSAHAIILLKAEALRRLAMTNYETAGVEGRRFGALRGDF